MFDRNWLGSVACWAWAKLGVQGGPRAALVFSSTLWELTSTRRFFGGSVALSGYFSADSPLRLLLALMSAGAASMAGRLPPPMASPENDRYLVLATSLNDSYGSEAALPYP